MRPRASFYASPARGNLRSRIRDKSIRVYGRAGGICRRPHPPRYCICAASARADIARRLRCSRELTRIFTSLYCEYRAERRESSTVFPLLRTMLSALFYIMERIMHTTLERERIYLCFYAEGVLDFYSVALER